MTTYSDVARVLASRIAAGEIAVGERLPSVRLVAAECGASQATAQRAYRELARWGVIETASRRTAAVAVGGAAAARRQLRGRAPFRIAAGDDPALRLLVPGLEDIVVVHVEGGSASALRAVRRGSADGAAIHLAHVDGGGNETFARAALAGRETSLLHLFSRETGLLVAPGNPHRVRSGSDLAGLRVARQPVGAGGRGTLDRLTQRAGIELDASDPVVPTASDVAIAIATGSADVGVGTRAIARSYDLAFAPLGWEALEVALATADEGGVAPIQTALADPAVRAAIDRLEGYDLSLAGTLTRLG